MSWSKSEFIKMLFIVIISLLFFVSNLISLNIFSLRELFPSTWIMLSIICFVIFIFIYKYKYFINGKLLFMLVWELLIISVYISKYIHGSFGFFSFLIYSILIPFVFFGKGILKFKKSLSWASVISIIPFLFLIGPGNSLAINISIIGVTFLIILKWNETSAKYKYFWIIAVSIMLIITESRTSLITFIIIATLYIIFTWKQERVSLRAVLERFIIIAGCSIIVLSMYDFINRLLFHKYVRSNEDITSGRAVMWEDTYKYGKRLFGNGEQYFNTMFGIGDAHNTFIQILGAYGIISISLYILLLILIIIKAFRLIDRFEYICFFLCFLILGLAENLFFIESRLTLIQILFFMFVGVLMNEEKTNYKNKMKVG